MIYSLIRAIAVLCCFVITSEVHSATSLAKEEAYHIALAPIDCPPSIQSFDTDLGMCSADIVVQIPTSSNPSCIQSISITVDGMTVATADGVYAVGDYVVEFTVTDDTGAVTTCSTMLSIRDIESPIIDCPNPLVVQCNVSNAPIANSILAFTAQGGEIRDNCSVDNMSFDWVEDQILTDPGVCPVEIRRIYEVMDSGGLEEECAQTIFITDDTDPTIVCPSDINEVADDNCEAQVSVPNPIVSDNCGPDNLTVTNDYNNTDNITNETFPLGSTQVTWTVTDPCGNSTDCMMTVTVTDEIDPVAVCQPFNLDIGANGMTPVLLPSDVDGGSSDNCNFTLSIDSAGPFGCDDIGNVNIILTATDDEGNTNSCTATVTIQDVSPPTLNCPSDETVNCSDEIPTPLTLMALEDQGFASDNCGLASSDVVVDDSDIDDCDGTVTHTYTVTDNFGLTATCTQTFTIMDQIAPTLTAPADVTVDCTVDITAVNNTGGMPTDFNDNCTTSFDNPPTFVDMDPGFDNGCAARVVERVWTIEDNCGNPGMASQFITIQDIDAPDWSGVTLPTIADISCTDFPDNLPPPPSLDASTGFPVDNCSGVTLLVVDMNLPAELSCDPAGTPIEYVYGARDECGNVSTESIVFNVMMDNEGPTIVGSTVDQIDDIACDDPLPTPQDPSTFTVTDNCSNAGDITFEFDIVYPDGQPDCVGYRVRYRWRAIDACGNTGPRRRRTFQVLPDEEPPSFTCLENITVNVDANSCAATYNPVAPDVSDNCNDPVSVNLVSLTSGPLMAVIPSGPNEYTLDPGTYTLTWSAMDACANETEGTENCIQTLTVMDDINPNIICQNQTVYLGYDGTAKLNATDAVIGTDNCPGPLNISIRDMDDNCDLADDEVDGDCVNFCCADTAGVQMVIGTVTDAMGNTATCMIEVNVIDNLPPVITCPNHVTINCDVPLGDYSQFGTIVENGETPQSYDLGNGVSVTDGVYLENCSPATVSVVVDESDLVCNMGMVTRTFTVTDGSGNTATCDQWITIMDDDPLVLDDITFPEEVFLMNECPFDPDNPAIGMPSFDAGPCTDAFVTFDDVVFDHPVSGCQLIDRTWIVIDWCQMDDDGNPVRFTGQQWIHLKNTNPPSVGCSDLELAINNNSCEASLSTAIFAVDDCTDRDDLEYTFDLVDADGNTVLSGTTSVITDFPLGVGEYEINWTADDQCGNVGTCVQAISVVDNKPPSPICITLLSTSLNLMEGMPDPMVEIWAKDFIQKADDNCDSEDDLNMTFDPAGAEMAMIFGCDQLGQNPLMIYTTDSAGNQTVCNVILNVDDTEGLCPCQIDLDCSEPVTINLASDPYTQVSLHPSDFVSDASSDCADPVVLSFDSSIVDTTLIVNCDVAAVNNPVTIYAIAGSQIDSCETEYRVRSAPSLCDVISYIDCDQDSICFPVVLNNVGALSLVEFGLSWVDSLLSFSSVVDGDLTGVSSVSGPLAGTVDFSWVDPQGLSVILPNESVAFTICFDVIGDLSSDLDLNIFDLGAIGGSQEDIDLCVDNATLNPSTIPVHECGAEPSINIQDQYIVCDDDIVPFDSFGNVTNAFINIAGQVQTEDGRVLENIEVYLNGPEGTDMAMTNAQGNYAFDNVLSDADYAVEPKKDDSYKSGITTLDIVLIQKHILGMQPLDSPYKVIAADVDNSESLSASDLIALRKLILGITPDLPLTTAWKFVDAGHVFTNLYRPWPYPAEMDMPGLDYSTSDMDFVAIKSGDVNTSVPLGNFQETETREIDLATLMIGKPALVEQGTYKIDVRLDAAQTLIGLQMSLDLGESVDLLGINAAMLGITDDHFAVNDGILTISYDQEYSSYLYDDVVLFELLVSAADMPVLPKLVDDGSFSSELYDESLSISRIILDSEDDSLVWTELGSRNIPNPFLNETTIHYNSKIKDDYTLYIYDNVGRLIAKSKGQASKGSNEIIITSEQLGDREGIYFYRIELDKYLYAGKMVMLN